VRLHLVTEGHGDVGAAPELAARVLRHLGRLGSWQVTKRSSRLPQGLLVDLQGAPRPEGVERAIGYAAGQRADALLLLVDGDDHCPAVFGPAATTLLQGRLQERLRASAVMVVREFETWLAIALLVLPVADAERKRDGKALLRGKWPDYKPTVHQAELARTVDVPALLATGSDSFAKFVREIDRLTC
jgi:hypothetical protein